MKFKVRKTLRLAFEIWECNITKEDDLVNKGTLDYFRAKGFEGEAFTEVLLNGPNLESKDAKKATQITRHIT